MLLSDFCCHPDFLLSGFITPHQQSVKWVAQYCSVDRRQAGDAGRTEFQSASSCEQKAASRLRPLMPPGRAIETKKGPYISHGAICLFASDTCCSSGSGPVIPLRAVTLENKVNDLIGHIIFGSVHPNALINLTTAATKQLRSEQQPATRVTLSLRL